MFSDVSSIKKVTKDIRVYSKLYYERAVCVCIDLGVGPMFPCGEQKELAYSKQCFLMFL